MWRDLGKGRTRRSAHALLRKNASANIPLQGSLLLQPRAAFRALVEMAIKLDALHIR
jgi:hypothetical protein